MMADEVAQQHPDNVGQAAQIIGLVEVDEGQPQKVDLGGGDNDRENTRSKYHYLLCPKVGIKLGQRLGRAVDILGESGRSQSDLGILKRMNLASRIQQVPVRLEL